MIPAYRLVHSDDLSGSRMSGGDPMMIEACGGLYEWFPHELGEP